MSDDGPMDWNERTAMNFALQFQEGQVREWRPIGGGSYLVELRHFVRTIMVDHGAHPGVDTAVPLWECFDLIACDYILCAGNRLGNPLTEMEVLAWAAK